MSVSRALLLGTATTERIERAVKAVLGDQAAA